jgi:hypothetical protein
MIISEVPVERLVPYARNPRNNTAAIDVVKASIAEFGFRQPIVVDEKLVVVGGCRKQHHGATFAKVGNTYAHRAYPQRVLPSREQLAELGLAHGDLLAIGQCTGKAALRIH